MGRMTLNPFDDRRLVYLIAALALLPIIDMALPLSVRVTPLMPPVLIFGLVGLGVTVVTGCTGLLHLGVAAFVAIGAFAFSILSCPIYPFQLPWIVALVTATIIGGISGLILGLPTIRLRGDYLAIVTLGFGEIVQDLLRNLETITKGTQGINPVRGPLIGSLQVSGETPIAWYYVVLAALVLSVIAIERLFHSPIGRAWRALRDDELAASCMGVNPASTKLLTFAISAALCALAGALLASFLGSSGEPSNYDFQFSIMALSMAIVGGLGSIPGAVVGAILMGGINSIVLAKLADWLASSTASSSSVLMMPGNWKYLIFGLALVLMMRFKNDGLLPPRRGGAP